ncbi:MAG: hypothetical protein Q3983_06270 [Capnocytophaga sp.]|nr:hypothetical protein [Capnocytophaga sp.]
MNKLITLIFLSFFIFACNKEKNETTYPDIKIGRENHSISEISINKLTERAILLSGGNEKFSVSIENSKFAQASINKDTLKIKALWEGETFATIHSHDKKAQLKIKVVPSELSISQDFVRLYPKDETKTISVSGGGDIVDMHLDDPEQAVVAKWNGSNGILELRAIHDGDATITFSSGNVTSKTLKISVRSEGVSNEIGIYSTTNRSIYSVLTPKMIVKRKGKGIWLSTTTNPYGTYFSLYRKVAAKIVLAEKNIQKDTYTDVNLSFYPSTTELSGIKEGKYQVFVEEIGTSTITLRGKGFRLVLPKEN